MIESRRRMIFGYAMEKNQENVSTPISMNGLDMQTQMDAFYISIG